MREPKLIKRLGVVIKQSSISAFFTYLGAGIGFVNTIILFPLFLSTEQIGLLRVIPSSAFLIVSFSQLGIGSTLLKFAPEFNKKPEGLSQLITFCVWVVLAGFILACGILFIFEAQITAYFSTHSALLSDYFLVVVALVLILSLYSLFEIYGRLFLKIIVQNIIKEVALRLMLTIGVSLYFLQFISFHQLVYSLIIMYGSMLMMMLAYLFKLGQLKFSAKLDVMDKPLLKRIGMYSLFVMIGAGSNNIVLNIDQLMISSELGLSANGIYSTVFYFAVMIELSRRVIAQITTPLVSDSLENQDLAAVEKIYKQTSINQMIVGGLFFIGLVCNLDNLFSLMSNGETFADGRYVVYFIGLSKVMEMTFANSSPIISMSKYYKFNVITIAILAILMICLNLVLIPAYGISGAAFASFLALFVFGIIKMIFIKVKLGFTPFTWANGKLLVIGVIVLVIGFVIPIFENTILDLVVRSIVIGLIYCCAIYFFKISKEINGGLTHLAEKFRGR
ncbi:Membrane protein involved in the export of O-antigen and teichoic acid [Reichenbachiella faecimaris]|uniref:Membrane protein involved in the export of O-antigen and teichoic acid n=1 Tax=Reichenbachiella faecimaris TaxID=692418 RepID=A0A1W2G7C3_REIFA|nr:polysaccharide biosynthesis C-terminal domain-containing protein [Reichenbachiella faecimaris]SMD32580.1 Membrane protein involved in the export of O-antigen and teichoic acid [Reichenbachiella faecimaris]